jgi:hypothetical protein
MSCAPPTERAWSRRQDIKTPVGLDPVEIDGTWDYKWRKNAVIKVAFQTPATDDESMKLYEPLIRKIIEIAGRWRTNIRADFDFDLPPAQGRVPLTLHFLKKQPLPQPNRVQLKEAVLYDVLISLAPLPVTIPPTPRRRGEDVILPRSELGRYARRLEYSIPTAFLGRFRSGQTLQTLSTDPEWEHTVLHEFGHILGLAHPFQQHNARVTWKTKEELRTILPEVLELDMTREQIDDYVERQFLARLPSPAESTSTKEPPFSDDWRTPEAPSTMNPRFLYKLAKVEGTTRDPGWLSQPTDDDLAHLCSMYGVPPIKGNAGRPPNEEARPTA